MNILNLCFMGPVGNVTHFTCCHDTGYHIYALSPILEKKRSFDFNFGIGILKIFNKTNLSVIVGGGSNPYKSKDILIFWDDGQKKSIIEMDMREKIRNAFIFKDRIIIVLKDKVCVFDWKGNLIITRSTYNNEKGVCTVCTIEDNLIIAMLGTKKGEITIWNQEKDKYINIEAHNDNIDVITLSNDGMYVATASEIGTIIRLYNILTQQLEYELRRGTSSAKIYDICLNKDTSMLACYSSNGTLHLFELYKDINSTINTKSILSSFQTFLPKYFASLWAFKQINIADTSKIICGFDDKNNIHMVTYTGNYYKVDSVTYNVSTLKIS